MSARDIFHDAVEEALRNSLEEHCVNLILIDPAAREINQWLPQPEQV